MGCQKHFTKIQKIKIMQSELKTIKIGKRPGTTYRFGCKDLTRNFRPQEVKMTNNSEKNQTVLFVGQISQNF